MTPATAGEIAPHGPSGPWPVRSARRAHSWARVSHWRGSPAACSRCSPAFPSSPDRQPSEVRLTWATVDPPGTPPIYDCFILRGALSRALPGMQRLLGLLAQAGIDVHPGQPIDLRALVGLECLIDVARDLDQSGFPFSRIVRYQPVARQNRAGDPRATHRGSRNDRPIGSHGPRDAAARLARNAAVETHPNASPWCTIPGPTTAERATRVVHWRGAAGALADRR